MTDLCFCEQEELCTILQGAVPMNLKAKLVQLID